MKVRESQEIDALHVRAGAGMPRRETARDAVAIEEPLEIRLHGATFMMTMRTPGADRALAAGLLLSERIIRGVSDVQSIEAQAGRGPLGNTVDVTLAGAGAARVSAALASRRLVATTSACGVCGRQSIDDLLSGAGRVDATWTLPASAVAAMPERLRAAQTVFEATGGLHAAGLFDRSGALLMMAEDVGRHNAVDKVVGAQVLEDRLPLSDRALFVSGRTSFEIVQKAAVAGIPVLAAVSAPSSLAITLAREANITLIGFVRDGGFNVYTGAERLEP